MLVKFEYQNMSIFNTQRGTLRSINLIKIPSWFTLSNPLEQSKKAANTFDPLLVK